MMKKSDNTDEFMEKWREELGYNETWQTGRNWCKCFDLWVKDRAISYS